MTDREKVIKGLMVLHGSEETMTIISDAIALLKELEPIAPSICGSKEPDGYGCWWYLCGKCKKPIDHKDRFCKRCGQAVKWE